MYLSGKKGLFLVGCVYLVLVRVLMGIVTYFRDNWKYLYSRDEYVCKFIFVLCSNLIVFVNLYLFLGFV